MNEDVKEISYYILQSEYLKRKNIDSSEENFAKIVKVFPEDWFTKYSLDEKIKFISIALKNNIDLENVLETSKDNHYFY